MSGVLNRQVTIQCTLCKACFNLCERNGISFKKINAVSGEIAIKNSNCIDCGLCERSCPQNSTIFLNKVQACFASYSFERNKKSSSGGVASTLYKSLLNKGWICYGVGGIKEKYGFIELKTEEDISKVAGSKYVFSDTKNIFSSIKSRLSEGKNVLFVGLPCQVAGLKSFLKKDYLNLYCCDLICHGAPSSDLFFEYLNEILKDKMISSIDFRNEKMFELLIYENDKVIYKKKSWQDPYYLSFLKSTIYRDSCYECKYATKDRIGDLTLGDFWGLDKNTFKNYHSFISCVLVNTSKGFTLFDIIKEAIFFVQKDIDDAVCNNPQLNSPSQKTKDHLIFGQNYAKTGNFKKSFNKTSLRRYIIKLRIRTILLYVPKKILSVFKRK